MDYATELRMKRVLKSLKLPLLVFLFLVFSVSVIAPEPDITYFDKLAFRSGEGIYVDTSVSPVRVKGQNVKIQWGYDVENVSVPYKFAEMPFWFEHNLPKTIDPCKKEIEFATTYPTSTWVSMDYNLYSPNFRYEQRSEQCVEPFDEQSCFLDRPEGYLLQFCDISLVNNVCDYTAAGEDGTYTVIFRSRFVPIVDVKSCPLEPNKRYNFQHRAEIPVGSSIVFDVNAVFNLPVLGEFKFLIPAPSWTSTVANDYNSGNAYDFNWTKVTWDGNVMPVGDDRLHNDLNQAFYDDNLIGYWKFDDVNASGTGVLDDTNQNNNGLLISGADINAWGLWDTNAGYFDAARNTYVNVKNTASLQADFNSGVLTVSAWIYPLSTATNLGIIGKTDGGTATNTSFQVITSTTNRLRVLVGDGIDFITAFSANNALVANRWQHIAATLDGSTITIYVNGNVNGTPLAETKKPEITTAKLEFGRAFSSASYDYSGYIDEIKIYNRALSAAEIQADYNSWMNSNYDSPVKDAGSAVNWDAMDWNAFVDVNNNVTVDYRGCSTADCSTAGDWQTNLRGNPPGTWETSIFADNNRYFQYRVNFDTNRQRWNPIRNGNGDKGRFGHFSNVVVTYSTIAGATCDCPVSGNWEISDGSVCTLSVVCSLSAGNLHISNGSLTVTSTGTLSVPAGYKIIIEKTSSKLVVEKGGKVVINK